MGMEAVCRVESQGRVSEGRALLEKRALLFRGDFRLTIPFSQMTRFSARRGVLTVVSPGGEAHFHLGARAEKWALKIRYPRNRLDKLGVKPGSRVWVRTGAGESLFEEELRGRDAAVLRRRPRLPADLIFLQAERVQDLGALSGCLEGMLPNGAIWVLWPKGRPHIKEDHVRKAGREAGLVDIKVVSFSERLSGLKLVIPLKNR